MTNPMPDGYPTLLAAIYVGDAHAAIDFYQRAFGAAVLNKVEFGGKIFNADLRIGDTVFAVGDATPEFGITGKKPGDPDTATFHLHTDDVDGVWAKAVEEGATIINRPETRFHGWRSGAVHDPFGHRWAIAKQVEKLAPAEMLERFSKATAAGLKS